MTAARKTMRILNVRPGDPYLTRTAGGDWPASDGVIISADPQWLKSDQLVFADLSIKDARKLALDILIACDQVERRPSTKGRTP